MAPFMHALPPAWPPDFPDTEWSEAAGERICDETKKVLRRMEWIRKATAENLVLLLHDTEEPHTPLTILHGLLLHGEQAIATVDPRDTVRILNGLAPRLRAEAARMLVWERVWAHADLTRTMDDLHPDDEDAASDNDESEWLPELGAWDEPPQRRIRPTDPEFTPFLEQYGHLRFLYERIVTGTLPRP